MDAIEFVKADHRTIEKLFAQFEKLTDRAVKQKRKVVDDVIRELSIHAAVEEQLLYPTLRNEVNEVADDALEAIEQHHVVKWLLEELRTMPPTHERFAPKMRVLMEIVRSHMKEEESVLLPELRRALGKERLANLGDAMVAAKKIAPTRPHPRAPDSPPGNLVAGPLAGMLDRGREAIRSLATRGRRMAEETAARGRPPARRNGGAKQPPPKKGEGARRPGAGAPPYH